MFVLLILQEANQKLPEQKIMMLKNQACLVPDGES